RLFRRSISTDDPGPRTDAPQGTTAQALEAAARSGPDGEVAGPTPPASQCRFSGAPRLSAYAPLRRNGDGDWRVRLTGFAAWLRLAVRSPTRPGERSQDFAPGFPSA